MSDTISYHVQPCGCALCADAEPVFKVLDERNALQQEVERLREENGRLQQLVSHHAGLTWRELSSIHQARAVGLKYAKEQAEARLAEAVEALEADGHPVERIGAALRVLREAP